MGSFLDAYNDPCYPPFEQLWSGSVYEQFESKMYTVNKIL